MKKEYRVKKNEDFQVIFKKGKSVANRQFVVYSLKKVDQPYFRIGISVSKKIGNAVKRNYIKRCIRKFFQSFGQDIRSGHDYLIIARKPTSEMDYHQIEKSLTHVLRLGKVLNLEHSTIDKK
ncbi:ribonuclease P protein component [Bacillus oleivorans]|uniref:Ribonuclease P protein component n=1 Tax=Bacillus oleivorans TaxID=1448271 RepID=A0A285CGR2_9BACI|nr:ribonuclease P protein component [Bacillus oleivorans]SNX66700.1 ribonuclease P protein component [Bacillus oleivorans]